jgi:hypothetical protein
MSEPTVLERCTRDDGSVDWNKVAKMTTYATSLRPVASVTPLTQVVEQGILEDKLPETVAGESLKNATEVQTIYF